MAGVAHRFLQTDDVLVGVVFGLRHTAKRVYSDFVNIIVV